MLKLRAHSFERYFLYFFSIFQVASLATTKAHAVIIASAYASAITKNALCRQTDRVMF